jgi:hypothetical protein
MESLWPRLADLPLTVEGCGYDRLHAVTQEVIAGIATVLEPYRGRTLARRPDGSRRVRVMSLTVPHRTH